MVRFINQKFLPLLPFSKIFLDLLRVSKVEQNCWVATRKVLKASSKMPFPNSQTIIFVDRGSPAKIRLRIPTTSFAETEEVAATKSKSWHYVNSPTDSSSPDSSSLTTCPYLCNKTTHPLWLHPTGDLGGLPPGKGIEHSSRKHGKVRLAL